MLLTPAAAFYCHIETALVKAAASLFIAGNPLQLMLLVKGCPCDLILSSADPAWTKALHKLCTVCTAPDLQFMPHSCCLRSLLPASAVWVCYIPPEGKIGFFVPAQCLQSGGNEQGGGDAMETCLGILDTSTSSRGSWLYLIKMIVVLRYLIRFRHL